MSPTVTVTDQDDEQDTRKVPTRRMSLPGDPEDMLIDEARCELRLPAFRDGSSTWPPPPGASRLPTSSSCRTCCRPNSPTAICAASSSGGCGWPADFDFDFAKNPNVTPEVVADLESPPGSARADNWS
jgi:hypothetical protein